MERGEGTSPWVPREGEGKGEVSILNIMGVMLKNPRQREPAGGLRDGGISTPHQKRRKGICPVKKKSSKKLEWFPCRTRNVWVGKAGGWSGVGGGRMGGRCGHTVKSQAVRRFVGRTHKLREVDKPENRGRRKNDWEWTEAAVAIYLNHPLAFAEKLNGRKEVCRGKA